MLCFFLTMNTSKESENFIYLFSHIRSFQGLFYHYALKSNGVNLLLHTKISRNIYQKVCFGNNTYSGIFTVISTIFFLRGGEPLRTTCVRRANVRNNLFLDLELLFSEVNKNAFQ